MRNMTLLNSEQTRNDVKSFFKISEKKEKQVLALDRFDDTLSCYMSIIRICSTRIDKITAMFSLDSSKNIFYIEFSELHNRIKSVDTFRSQALSGN